MQDFRGLKVWKSAHTIAVSIYEQTKSFPAEERYGLTSQLRRSAMSVPSNIAEGCGRGSDADFARFLQIAMGSASELEYQILFAYDVGLMEKEEHDRLTREVVKVKRMLNAFLKKLRANSQQLIANS